MSDPDLWESVLTGGAVEAAPPALPQKEEEEAPEMAPRAAAPPQTPEPPLWEPFHFKNDTDISDLTDEQIEECFALDAPPWLAMGADLPPTAENIARLGKAFVGKRNPVPIRRPGKEWHAEHRDLTKEDFVRHLTGKWLLGAYLLDENDMTGVAVCDIDAEGDLKEGLLAGRYYPYLDLAHWSRVVGAALSVALASGVHVTLTGGKGAHATCVLPERAPAAIIRRQLHWMCVDMGLKRSGLQWAHQSGDFFVECFPKQDEAGKGLGNLIRLPNGTDPTTGRKCLVVTDDPPAVTEDTTVQPMYRVNPIGAAEHSRRAVQVALDDGGPLDWLEGHLGERYDKSFHSRCAALLTSEVHQMRNAVGQAIHMAGWANMGLATGLLSELEMTGL